MQLTPFSVVVRMGQYVSGASQPINWSSQVTIFPLLYEISKGFGIVA